MSNTYLFPSSLPRPSASPQLQLPSPPLFAPGFTATTSLSGCGVKPSRQREVLPSLIPARTYFLDSRDKFSRRSGQPRTTSGKQEWHWLALQPLLSFSHNIFFALHHDIRLGHCCHVFYILLLVSNNRPWLQSLPCCKIPPFLLSCGGKWGRQLLSSWIQMQMIIFKVSLVGPGWMLFIKYLKSVYSTRYCSSSCGFNPVAAVKFRY